MSTAIASVHSCILIFREMKSYRESGVTRMINKHICTLGWAAAFAVTTVSAAAAAPFDGNWNVIVYTTNGHCGVTNWQVGIAGGQVYSTGAMLGGYPAGLGGAVAPSGQVRFNGVAGPRNASGGGRFVTKSRERNLGRSGPLGQMLRGVERNSGLTGWPTADEAQINSRNIEKYDI
jgi:hypothetical protein